MPPMEGGHSCPPTQIKEGKKGQPLMFGMDEGKGESLGEENDVRL